jgi:MFS family permease
VLKNRATWPGFFANAGLSGAFFTFAGLWAVPYLTQMHAMSRATASNHVSIYFLGFAVGSALWGRVSDSLGKRKPVALAVSGLHVLGWATWLWATWQAGAHCLWRPLTRCASVMGLASAGLTLSWASAKEVNPPQLSGMATSVVNVGVFLGPAILQPMVGWLMERTWDGRMDAGVRIYSATDWRNGMMLLAAAAMAGWCATLLVKETGCRNIYNSREK